jgi:ATP-binding cassette subfamily B protein
VDGAALERTSLRGTLSALVTDGARTLRILASAAPGVVGWLAVWSLLEGLATVGMPYVAKRLVDSVAAARASAVLWVPVAWLGVELGLAAIRAVAQRGTIAGTQILEARGTLDFTRRVLAKACNIEYRLFENETFVSRLGRAREDATVHAAGFGIQAFTIVRAAVTFVGCLGLLWTTSVWSLPILVAAALPAFVLDTSLARRAFALERRNLHRNRRGWYLEWLLTAEQTAKELRSLAAGRWLVALFERIHAPYRDGQVALARRSFRLGIGAALLGVVALYAPYLFIVVRTVRGQTSLGGMLLFVLAFQQGATALGQVFTALARALQLQLYVRNVLDVLSHPEDDPESGPAADGLLTEAPELVLEDVWFSYPGSARPVLRGLDLRVRAGETLAIVGRNGIGKSTMVKLLVGLYPVDRGRILLNGIDVATRPASWRRQNIAVVFQDFVRYQFSALWNVGIGWHPDADDGDAVARAVEMADARGVIDSLPEGLATPLGTAFGGRDVSGGQWQRLALARLFMRRSRLWILDEPTSAMDPDAEEETFRRFRQWTRGRTAIIVAHRFSTVRIADRIAVVDEGQVIELGTHEELLAANGHYARMFRTQARAYLDAAERDEPIDGVAATADAAES